MQRAIEIAEKIVAEYRALANMHAHEAQAVHLLPGLHDPRHQADAREARMKIAEGCSIQADGAEHVLNALRAEAERQAARIPESPAQTWAVEFRGKDWPEGNWTKIGCVSEADAIQVARRVYRDARQCGEVKLSPILVKRDVTHVPKYGDFKGRCDGVIVYNENSPEITRYWRVIYGPRQEAFVGQNVPVWQIVTTLRREGIDPANLTSPYTTMLHGPLRGCTPDGGADACAYYCDHKAEIDKQIGNRT